MKKQKQNNKLVFNSFVVTELNNSQLQEIKGGTSLSSRPCEKLIDYVETWLN